MTRELKWRILSLQAVVILILACGAGLTFAAHSFTQDQVRTELSAQQIMFPPATSPAIKALPAADAAAMTQYAGQMMTTGYQAQTFANHFIAVHLKEIGKGKTYDYYSGKALAEQTSNPKQYVIDNGIALTLFRGETLRSMLLDAYAFWFVGDLALYGSFVLGIGALVVLIAFLFELLYAPKHEVEIATRPSTRPAVAAR